MRRSESDVDPYVGLIAVVLWLVMFIGWIANIVKLTGMELNPVTTDLILRIVGIPVFPLGGIMGFL